MEVHSIYYITVIVHGSDKRKANEVHIVFVSDFFNTYHRKHELYQTITTLYFRYIRQFDRGHDRTFLSSQPSECMRLARDCVRRG